MKGIYKAYMQAINTLYSSGEAREESYYPALKDFLESSFEDFISITSQPKKNIAGTPDFLIKDKNQKLIGYIEAKHLEEKDLYGIAETEQLKRYRESLPNLILTNFLEFHLYRDGNLIDTVRLTDAKSLFIEEKMPRSIKNLEAVKLLLEKFISFSIPSITTSKVLAIELAKRTRLLQFVISEELKNGNADLKGFLEAFKDNLMPSLTEDKFSDMYSQTITYGLFSSRMKFNNTLVSPLIKGGKGGFSEQRFSRLTAYQSIPSTIPFLKRLFYFITGPNLPQSIEWIADDIASVLENTDIKAIHKELHTERWIDDPVIHFYETFLSVYNPSEREKLGVYYTPPPVVSFIVKSINKLLKDKFGKVDGLADSSVIILDPASGTMTFPTLAIKLIKSERNIQPLSDDYIKFIRFAQWKIEKTGKGIVGFITNNSYLSGLIHRGMRKRLFSSFDEIYILNLHGSSRTGEKPPDGIVDENVFNIQQGVAIGLFLKI